MASAAKKVQPIATDKAHRFGPAIKYAVVPESTVGGLDFSAKKNTGKESPYARAVEFLLSDDGEGKVLCFESPKARGSLMARARKMNVTLLYAERDGKLYVKLGGPADGGKPDRAEIRRGISLASAVRNALAGGPRTTAEVVAKLAQDGVPQVSANSVSATLCNLERQGDVKKRSLDNRYMLVDKSGAARA